MKTEDGRHVRPIKVRVIASDGTSTAVRGREVTEGMEVVIGEAVAVEQGGDTTNPFAPKLFKGRK